MGNERKYSLDVLRIIATILIVFHHYGQVTGLYLEGHINYWNGRFYFGYVVEFFFLLSGYFMYREDHQRTYLQEVLSASCAEIAAVGIHQRGYI